VYILSIFNRILLLINYKQWSMLSCFQIVLTLRTLHHHIIVVKSFLFWKFDEEILRKVIANVKFSRQTNRLTKRFLCIAFSSNRQHKNEETQLPGRSGTELVLISLWSLLSPPLAYGASLNTGASGSCPVWVLKVQDYNQNIFTLWYRLENQP